MTVYSLATGKIREPNPNDEQLLYLTRCSDSAVGSTNETSKNSKSQHLGEDERTIFKAKAFKQTRKTKINPDGSYYDQLTGMMVVPSLENFRDYKRQYLSAQDVKAQQTIAHGINHYHYVKVTDVDILTGEVTKTIHA